MSPGLYIKAHFLTANLTPAASFYSCHDDVIKWKHFPRNWPFVRKIHRSPVNFPHKGQWRGALMFSLIYVWINDWANNREAGDLRRQHGHYDVIVMARKNIVRLESGAVISRSNIAWYCIQPCSKGEHTSEFLFTKYVPVSVVRILTKWIAL